MKYRIGYVDEDPIQVKKYQRLLGDKFEVLGYDIPKGLSKKKLLNQIYDSNIDLLLIDYLMTERGQLTYNGDVIAREFEKLKPHFPVLIFTSHAGDAFPAVDNPNTLYEKGNARKMEHFSEVLKRNIESYKSLIIKRKKSIDKLVKVSKKRKLNAKEEEALFNEQIQLQLLDTRFGEAPFQLLHPERIKALSKTANMADAFIKSLTKK
ncbi:MAG: response regulator [Sphingobacteriales bacterium]|nr:response regulator [Sphingobacteriales bacterium]